MSIQELGLGLKESLAELHDIDYSLSIVHREALEPENSDLVARCGGPFGYMNHLIARRDMAVLNIKEKIHALSIAASDDHELQKDLAALDIAIDLKYRSSSRTAD